tara:strand:- start:150 stop:1049 length:900 start_codon:yes stop_codon:yes gene_type:complete
MLGSLVSAGLGLLGSYQAQRKLGEAQDSMREAGDKAFKEGQYKPYGITSGSGTASFKDGQASFAMDPRYQAQQNQMFGLGTSALDRAGGSYDDLANDMYNRQRNIGAGAREGEAQRLGESMFGSGTSGLRVSGEALGAGGGAGMLSPDGYGFAQAFAQQDAMDRNNAFAQAQQQRAADIAVGTGMFSQGQAMDDNALAMIGAGGQLGAQQSAANNNAMSNYMGGYKEAAGYTARRGQSIAGGLTGLGSSLGSFSGMGGNSSGFSNPYAWNRSSQGGITPQYTSLYTPSRYRGNPNMVMP